MDKIEIKYSIRYSLQKITWNLVFVALGIYLLYITNFDVAGEFTINNSVLPLLAVIFIFYYGKKIIIEVLHFKRKIIFTNHGIEVNKRFFGWNDIRKQKIISKKEYTPKYSLAYLEFYLNFQYKSENIEIKIDDYSTSVDEIENLLKKFSKKY